MNRWVSSLPGRLSLKVTLRGTCDGARPEEPRLLDPVKTLTLFRSMQRPAALAVLTEAVDAGKPVIEVPLRAGSIAAMRNVLLEPVDYRIEETPFGTWRRFLSPTGFAYAEFTSHRRLFGVPLFAYTAGICPETGRRKMAKGIVAVGKSALGVVAIGQLAIGLFPIGQLSLGLLFGLGQFSTGLFAVGQFAVGALFGFGQFATGFVAIGQLALGWHVVAQQGAALGADVWRWSQLPEFFRNLFGS